jgi:hypothetical protein
MANKRMSTPVMVERRSKRPMCGLARTALGVKKAALLTLIPNTARPITVELHHQLVDNLHGMEVPLISVMVTRARVNNTRDRLNLLNHRHQFITHIHQDLQLLLSTVLLHSSCLPSTMVTMRDNTLNQLTHHFLHTIIVHSTKNHVERLLPQAIHNHSPHNNPTRILMSTRTSTDRNIAMDSLDPIVHRNNFLRSRYQKLSMGELHHLQVRSHPSVESLQHCTAQHLSDRMIVLLLSPPLSLRLFPPYKNLTEMAINDRLNLSLAVLLLNLFTMACVPVVHIK